MSFGNCLILYLLDILNIMKVLLFDADGVILKSNEYFSERFARDHSVPVEEIIPFFKNEFRVCQEGKADLKAELEKYLPKWKWDKSVDDFIDYWFTTDAQVNEELFVYIQKLRAQGITCYLASDQEKYRAEYLRNVLGFKQKLDGCFFSCELGFKKSQPEFFEIVVKELNVEPHEIVYFDDEQGNMDTAISVGIDARLYSRVQNLPSL